MEHKQKQLKKAAKQMGNGKTKQKRTFKHVQKRLADYFKKSKLQLSKEELERGITLEQVSSLSLLDIRCWLKHYSKPTNLSYVCIIDVPGILPF